MKNNVDLDFKKSSFSSPGTCVEVKRKVGGSVSVRDSKIRVDGTLSFTKDEWSAFLKGAKEGEFDIE